MRVKGNILMKEETIFGKTGFDYTFPFLVGLVCEWYSVSMSMKMKM